MTAVALIACATSTSAPSPSSSPRADSKAASFRTRLDVLLGEQVFIVAKQSVAAASARKDEYRSYAGILATNGGDLMDLYSSAMGSSDGAHFGQIWGRQNSYLVDYTVGVTTHNQSLADTAASNLTGAFVTTFAAFLSASTDLSADKATQLLSERATNMKTVIDDEAAGQYPKLYGDLGTAYTQTSRLGDALAVAIVQKFPDKFPGDPASRAADMRAGLDLLLQQHIYLGTMASDAVIAGGDSEHGAADKALAAGAAALGDQIATAFGALAGTRFSQVWTDLDSALKAYSKAADDGARQAALKTLLEVAAPGLSAFLRDQAGMGGDVLAAAIKAELLATVHVMDDQSGQKYDSLAVDDRAAAAQVVAIGDSIAGAAAGHLG
jgi:hypothetical protein